MTCQEFFGEAIIPLVEDMPFAKADQPRTRLPHVGLFYVRQRRELQVRRRLGADRRLRFRAMAQRAVRAANIARTVQPGDAGNRRPAGRSLRQRHAGNSADRPAPCALHRDWRSDRTINGGTLSQPTSGQVNSFFGGNPNVTPEEADTVTFGVVWQPDFIPGLAVTVDYYDIEVDNAISIRPNFDIVDGCYNLAPQPDDVGVRR